MVKEGCSFPVRRPPRVGKSPKHPPPTEDILREPICNVLPRRVITQPSGELLQSGYFTRLWAVSSIKFGLHITSSNRKERASPLATVEVEWVAVTGGMLCALSIPDSPKKLNVEMKRRDQVY